MAKWFQGQIGQFLATAKVIMVPDSLGVPGSDFIDVQVQVLEVEYADGRCEFVSREDIEYVRESIQQRFLDEGLDV